MKFNKTLVSLVAIFALAVSLIASASASITGVEVSGVDMLDNVNGNIAVFAGQTVPVRIIFDSTSEATDVRVKAWISGDKELSVSTDRFDILANTTYSRLLSVQVPSDIDPQEDLTLNVLVESRDGTISFEEPVTLSLSAQRESYAVNVLDAIMDSEVKAGSNLAIDVVLKNIGRQFSEDTFVSIKIPALGIQKRAYFGDLSPKDDADADKEDAVERSMTLNIPSNAPAGIYLVEINAYNSDSSVVATKRVAITNDAEVKEDGKTPVTPAKSVKGFTSTTLVLTIILAIIFVVLLVVLIVLLTRKPQKAEEFGESYY